MEDADGTQTVFRTLDLISSTRVEREAGKSTRIYEAIEVRDGTPHGEPVVLKDVWRHEELGREGDTLGAIRQCDPSQAARDLISRRTLTVLHHGDVVLRTPSVPHPYVDFTREHSQNAVRFLQHRPLTDSRFMHPSEEIEPHYVPEDGRRIFLGRKFHYRVVFKELCRPLFEQPLAAVFASIRDICEGKTFESLAKNEY